MCGIAGGWSYRRFLELDDALPRITNALAHRGPDAEGRWSDPDAGIALGHRRLSIVDLSSAGRQPMASASGRWVIAFNGEIYNHQVLRSQLDAAGLAPAWRGHSDTEALLAAIEAWGVEEALERSIGMFAIALWDRDERALWLMRDRFGEKPLYYGWNRGVFLFASELKALRAFPGFEASVDRNALAAYVQHNAVPAPLSIYGGIQKLLPGSWLRMGQDDLHKGRLSDPSIYWSPTAKAAASRANLAVLGRDEAVDALEALLRDAIGQQMTADVPLGAFLSGGVDSSLVAALMQAQAARPVRTFSIGFQEDGYNEAHHAAAVAAHLQTDHTELYVSSADAMSVIPSLADIYDEPFADSSQIPTVLLARMARKHVTVALSGDGGDELFGGYSRYAFAANTWRRMSQVPTPIRRMIAKGIAAVPIGGLNAGLDFAAAVARRPRFGMVADKLHKGAALLGEDSQEAFYRKLITHWSPGSLLIGFHHGRCGSAPSGAAFDDFREYMMLQDTAHYLPDDILVKVDRAAMSCSLETRIPMLDHRIFEFAWRLPLDFKIRGGVGKHCLREVLYRHVPRSLIDRPKKGFGVPIDVWLRGPLREWASDLLDPTRLRDEGYFNPAPVTKKWDEHLSGVRNWQHHLWDILMFQAWLSRQKEAVAW
jgi:asparagine synthase (glutamine-hydrolysing)